MPESEKLTVWVLNSKGGVGKTTLAIAIYDLLELSGRPPTLLEVDTRRRLSSFMEKEIVRSFDGAPPLAKIRQDPNLVLSHYDPIVEAIAGGDTLLDLGANEDGPFLEYCKLSRLDEDLGAMGVRAIVLIPTVAETESVRGALSAVDDLQRIVPSAMRVVVMNQRDRGNFSDYFTPELLKKLDEGGTRFVEMGRIDSEGWDDFQRSKKRFIDAIEMTPEAIQAEFRYPRPKAKRARGDIAFWFRNLHLAMAGILPAMNISAASSDR